MVREPLWKSYPAAACFVPFRVAASHDSEGDLLAAAIDLA
jgi:hypothetical protein